jgi:DNA-binding MarR family transcriptional regulator
MEEDSCMDETLDVQLREAVRALRAVVLVAQTFRRRFAETYDLALSDTVAMSHLAASGPLSAGELAHRTGLAPSSLTSRLDRLERLGLATRTTPLGDRRAVSVALTATGEAALRETETLTARAMLEVGADCLPEFTRCLQILATELQRVATDYTETRPSTPSSDQPM